MNRNDAMPRQLIFPMELHQLLLLLGQLRRQNEQLHSVQPPRYARCSNVFQTKLKPMNKSEMKWIKMKNQRMERLCFTKIWAINIILKCLRSGIAQSFQMEIVAYFQRLGNHRVKLWYHYRLEDRMLREHHQNRVRINSDSTLKTKSSSYRIFSADERKPTRNSHWKVSKIHGIWSRRPVMNWVLS